MTPSSPDLQGLLVLPRIRVQNANAISSPMTHGFPAMTAFLGMMWALDRRLAEAGLPLSLSRVGVICHDHQEHVHKGYVRTFHLTRNPVMKDGSTAAIVEEGRIHLDVTLVFDVAHRDTPAKHNVLLQGKDAERDELAWHVMDIVSTLRIAGGTVVPTLGASGQRQRPRLLPWPDGHAERAKVFRQLRRAWLPGFTLVSRDDLLNRRLGQLRESDSNATALQALLDLSRFNYRSYRTDENAVAWRHDRPLDAGWVVPIPVGYTALSELYAGGSVAHARDADTPVRFVEGVCSLGQWISPHRLSSVEDLLWQSSYDADTGTYRCRNHYVVSTSPYPDLEEDTSSPAGGDAEWDV